MNILYINHYAGSPKHGMEYRPYYMSREWIKAGNRVRIVASAYSHVRSVQPNINGLENVDGVEYYWVPATKYFENGVRRVLNIFSFLFVFFVRLKSILNDFKPDVVIASSTYPLDIYLSRFIAKKYSAKLIFEVHDLWPLSPIELGGMSKDHPFIRLCQHAENFAYKHADSVVSMLPVVHEHMEKHGLDLNRLTVIPNGVSLVEWDYKKSLLRDDIREFILSSKNNGYRILCYAGAHGLPNGLDYLIDAATLVSDEKIRIILVGDGLDKARLVNKVKSGGVDNVFFFPPIPKNQIPTLLDLIDIAYIGLQYQPLFRFGISPNKMMDYMMAGKPIISAIDAGNNPVKDANCGVSVSPDPNAIADGIVKLLKLSKAELMILGANGHDYVTKNHSYDILGDKFIKVMK
ncbi:MULTISPECIES: glycosyltransferase family 4 protein [Plesiomonas]|uniref:Glycosyltransferase WbuB n=2 Tax=Plesiomonas shigelloides TaxID=703 RepID=A0A4D6U7T5_PLESH|nr:glycosyltransferase [Plesiomonas shigelloides]MCE5164949.1 glycosyltransferase family 4 protein [Plesiomonas sp. PI-19]QCH03307.1 glycosyltransferase WbuB [Plesiomonas shigelloides]